MNVTTDGTEPDPVLKRFLGFRHLQIFLLFFGLVVTFINRIDLSEGLVGMTQLPNETNVATINLTTTEKGGVSGAFFWGYAITSIPGGFAAIRFGPTKTLAVSLAFCGLFSFLTPVMALKLGFGGLYAVRIGQGLAQGPIYPAIHTHMSKWAVPHERGVLFACTSTGAQMGTMFIMVTGGFLSSTAGGWPVIFYFSGGLAIFWVVLCLFLIADSPAQHRRISPNEKLYIETNCKGSSKHSHKMKIPWLAMCLSRPAWAILLAHLAYNWGYWSLISLTPTYLHSVYKFNMKKSGILSALPYLAMLILTLSASPVADFIIKKKILSIGTVRKIMNSVAFWIGGFMLIILGLAVDDETGSVVCLVLASASFSGVYTGFLVNPMDLSPNFAGLIVGITNCLSNITSISGPTFTGLIIHDETSQRQWQIFFTAAGSVLFAGNLLYLLMASGKIQPWNDGVVSEKSSNPPNAPQTKNKQEPTEQQS